MHSDFTFLCDAFRRRPEEAEGGEAFINPGIFAADLAAFVAEGLTRAGYRVGAPVVEDWGIALDITHDGGFRLMVGCNSDDFQKPVQHRVYLEPARPTIRRWFKRIDTRPATEPLSAALEALIRARADIAGIEVQNL